MQKKDQMPLNFLPKINIHLFIDTHKKNHSYAYMIRHKKSNKNYFQSDLFFFNVHGQMQSVLIKSNLLIYKLIS